MADREKMINELTFQLNSKEVKEQHYPIQLSVSDATKIVDLLKAQKPRVLSLYEIQTLPNGDETNAPVVTEQRVPIGTWDGGSICQWRGAAFVQETAEDHDCYNWDTYGQNWRCWTALPTKKQRKEAKWDADP